MDWQTLLYLIPYLASGAISLGVGLYAWRRRAIGAMPYAVSTLGSALWTLGFILELLNPSLAGKVFWDNVQFGAMFVVPVAGVMFALEYTGRKLAHPQRAWAWLSIVPALSLAVIFTDPWHHLIRPAVALVPRTPAPELSYAFTPLVLLMAAYVYGLLVTSLLLLLNLLLRQHHLYRIQTGLILVGFLLPFLGSLLTLSDISLGPYRDIFPLTSGLGNLLAAIGLFRYRLFDLIPVAREAVVESMSDLVIVLDTRDRVVDINPAALKFIQRRAVDVIGQTTAQVFAQWPDLVDHYQHVTEDQAEVTLDFPEGPRHFDLRLSPLRDQFGQLTGRLAVARDITDHKLAQAALRRAQAETEQRVQERTTELATANAALRAQIAERERVENFVRHSEAKYRTLFESASDAIFLMQAEHFVDCNARALSMFGCERQQIIGQTPMRFSPPRQSDGRTSDEHAQERIQLALAGTPQSFEWRHVRYDATPFAAEVSLNRVDLETGPFLLAIVRDVTERQRAAAEKARLVDDLNERVKELTVLHATMRLLQQPQETTPELLQRIVASLPAAWQYPDITAARITVADTEAATENFSPTPWSQRAEFLTAQGEPGAVEVVYLEARPPAVEGPFLAEERRLINSLAELLHAYFERQRVETALRQNEERLRLMIEHMPIMVDALDANGQIVLWNRECERVTGYSAAEIVGQPNAFEKLYPDARYRDQMLAEWQVRGNNYVGWAWDLTAKDGATRTIEWSNISDRIPLFNWPNWGIGIDVTERRRAEAAEQRYAARMEILHEIDRAILAAHSPEETALAALTRIRRLVPCRRASVSLFDFQAREARLLAVSVNGQTHLSPGRGITLEVFGLQAIETLRQGQPYIIEDLLASTNVTEEDRLYIAQGVVAWLTAPLFFQGELIGALNLGRDVPGPFSADDLQITREVADQLSISIQQARLFEDTQRRMHGLAGLHEIAQAFNSLTDARETYGALVEHLAKLVGARRGLVMLSNEQGILLAQPPGYGLPVEWFQTEAALSRLLPRGWGVAPSDVWLANSLKDFPEALRAVFQGQQIGNALAAPLLIEQTLLGSVIILDKPGGFTADDARLLGVVAAQAAVVIHNAQLYEAEHVARQQTDALLAVARTVSSTLSLREVLLRILEQCARLLPYISGSITVYEHGQPTLMALAGHEGREDVVIRDTYEALSDSPILKRLLDRRQPLLISNVDDDPDWVKYPATAYIRSWLGIPLIAHEQVMGVLSLDGDQPQAFTAQHLVTAQALATQAAIAIDNAQRFTAEQAAREQAEALRAASAAITQSLELGQVLDSVLEYLHRLVPYDSASVFLIENTTHLTVHAARGYEQWAPPAEGFRGVTLDSAAMPILRTLLTTQTSLMIPDTQAYPDWVQHPTSAHVRNWIGVPLIAAGQVIGVYSLDKATPHFFTTTHMRLAEVLSAQGVAAIQNARLFEQVNSGREQLQALSRQLVEVQEDERRHLARELHDEVGQMLTGLKLMLGVVPRLPPEKVGHQINEGLTVLNRLTERVHDLSLDLRPMMLDDLGLVSALLWLFDRFTAQTGVRVNFESVGLEERLTSEVETTTYRLIQEALTNIARYAGVDEALVRLRADGAQLRLQIQDAGRGFEVAAVLAAGQRVGLAGMKERAALLGGWLRIESATGMGTQITAALPLHGRLERRKHDRLNPDRG